MNPDIAAFETADQRNFQHVRINREALVRTAKLWKDEVLAVPDWRAPVFPETDNDTFVNFLGLGNALNYCFADTVTKEKFATEYKGIPWKGAFGMWASLKRALEEGVPLLNPDFLMNCSRADVAHIFRGNPPLPLPEVRLVSLRGVGVSWKLRLKDHTYADLFRDCNFRAFNNGNGIVEQVVANDLNFFDVTPDMRSGKTFRFHKRANLFVMMYHGRALASNGTLPPIRDIENVTPPADYEVPKALRHLGILEYSSGLSRMVDTSTPITANSREELEIRVQTVVAMRRLLERLSALRREPLTIAELDYKVWSAGKTDPRPHHLTSTIAY